MDMRKLSLSLLIVAGVINFTYCLAEEKLLLPEEVACLGRIADAYIKITTNKEFIDLEERQVAFMKKLNNLIDGYILCNALGNCDELPNLKSLYDQTFQEARQIEDKILKIQEATGTSKDSVDGTLFMQCLKNNQY
jgi:hypothetical protein